MFLFKCALAMQQIVTESLYKTLSLLRDLTLLLKSQLLTLKSYIQPAS